MRDGGRLAAFILVFATVLVAAGTASASYTAKLTGGVLTFTGNGASDKLVLRLNGGSPCKLQGDVGGNGTAEFQFRCSSVSQLVVNAGGGNDVVLVSEVHGPFTNFSVTTLRGGAGKDTLAGGSGGETLVGGRGVDAVTPKGGNDTVVWTVGDGSEAVVGQSGADSLRLLGKGAGNEFFLSSPGGKLHVAVGAERLVPKTIESVGVTPVGDGAGIFVRDLTGAGVDDILLDLGSPFGTDVIVDGTAGPDTVTAAFTGSEIDVQGLGADLHLTGLGQPGDVLVVNGLGGDDTLSAPFNSGQISLQMDGGEGSDVLTGSNADDFLNGAAGNDTVEGNGGNDTVFLGEGNDAALWAPGDASDVVEGQAGLDLLDFNGASAAEVYQASSNGGRLQLTRSIGNITMDTDDVEIVDLHALGGVDSVTVNDLGPTDVSTFVVNLGVSGVGDGAADAVVVNGTTGVDLFNVSGSGGSVSIQSVPFTVSIVSAEPANDTLTVNLLDAADIFSAASLAGTSVALTVNGGNGNDIIVGSQGDDALNGDANTDYIDGGLGADSSTGGETVVNVP